MIISPYKMIWYEDIGKHSISHLLRMQSDEDLFNADLFNADEVSEYDPRDNSISDIEEADEVGMDILQAMVADAAVGQFFDLLEEERRIAEIKEDVEEEDIIKEEAPKDN